MVASITIVFKLIETNGCVMAIAMSFTRQRSAGLVKLVKKLSAKCRN